METAKDVGSLLVSKRQDVSELTLPVPWGQIRGQVWGPDNGSPVLCLHGMTDNSCSFNTLIPLLPTECRYVAIDLAGHGLSTHRPPGVFYTFPAYVADVRRVVKALHWERFSIIGHSMGGNIAGMFSALYPEMVNALILLDVVGFLASVVEEIPAAMRQGMEGMFQYEDRTERVYTYEQAFKRLQNGNPTLSERSAHVLLERGLRHVEGGVVFTRDFRTTLKNVVYTSLEESVSLQSRITFPTLLLLAKEGFDIVCTDPNLKEYISILIQGFRNLNGVVVEVPGDHHVHLNHPENVAPFVSDFLQSKVLSQLPGNTPTAKL